MIFSYISFGILIILVLFTLLGLVFGISDTKATGGKVDWKQARKDALDGLFRGILVLGFGMLGGLALLLLLSGLTGTPLPWL